MSKTFLKPDYTRKLFLTAVCAKTKKTKQEVEELMNSGYIIKLKVKRLVWTPQGLEIHY